MGQRHGELEGHRSVRPPVRVRHGRVVSALAAVAVTVTAVLAAGGLIPVAGAGSGAAAAAAPLPTRASPPAGAGIALSAFDVPARIWDGAPGATGTRSQPAPEEAPAEETADTEALPRHSGTGKRVVFDISAQRVWLVESGRRVLRTYLVSGSLTDNLRPGTYEVYSTSRHAVGIDDSGTMQYMVRFARGERAAIGFHDIPIDKGRPVQTRAQLGTPQSHGCIRQWRPDARALWYFAIVGTKVVVTA